MTGSLRAVILLAVTASSPGTLAAFRLRAGRNKTNATAVPDADSSASDRSFKSVGYSKGAVGNFTSTTAKSAWLKADSWKPACVKPPPPTSSQSLGKEYFCPCSCSVAEAFGSVRGREDALCAADRSVERQRFWCIYAQAVLLPALPRSGLKVLHFAPEPAVLHGLGLLHTPRVSTYVMGDLDPSFYRKRLVGEEISRLDVTHLDGFADKTFDLVICLHILEHVPDDATAFRELFRVMKPGGYGIVEVPWRPQTARTYEDWNITTPAGREKAFHQWNHVRIYGRDFVQRAQAAGFAVKVVDELNFYQGLPQWDRLKHMGNREYQPPADGLRDETTVFHRPLGA